METDTSPKKETLSHLKINDETKEQFLMEIKNNIDENTSIESYENVINSAKDQD